MELTYHNVHNKFKLNGFHFDKNDLCRVAYSFIKEGEIMKNLLAILFLIGLMKSPI